MIYKCADCEHEVKVNTDDQIPFMCPNCGSINIGYDREEEDG